MRPVAIVKLLNYLKIEDIIKFRQNDAKLYEKNRAPDLSFIIERSVFQFKYSSKYMKVTFI